MREDMLEMEQKYIKGGYLDLYVKMEEYVDGYHKSYTGKISIFPFDDSYRKLLTVPIERILELANMSDEAIERELIKKDSGTHYEIHYRVSQMIKSIASEHLIKQQYR